MDDKFKYLFSNNKYVSSDKLVFKMTIYNLQSVHFLDHLVKLQMEMVKC